MTPSRTHTSIAFGQRCRAAGVPRKATAAVGPVEVAWSEEMTETSEGGGCEGQP